MKVVQVLLSERIGGAEALAETLHRAWTQGPQVESQVIYLDEGSKKSRFRRLVSIRRRLRTLRPDCIVAHSAIPNTYVRVAAQRGIPVVCVLHSASDDFSSWTRRWTERLLRMRTAAVVAVSSTQADVYRSHFSARGPEVRVIPNGLPMDWAPKSIASVVPRTVVTLGRVVPQKCPDFWIDIAKAASVRLPHLTFEWWGPIPDSALASAQQLLGLSETEGNAFFRGSTSTPNDVLRSADIFLHTSVREAHSIALLEAAASGLPVIHSEQIEPSSRHGEWFSFVPGSVDSVLGALEAVERHWDIVANRAIEEAPAVVEEGSSAASAYLELLCEVSHQRGDVGRVY